MGLDVSANLFIGFKVTYEDFIVEVTDDKITCANGHPKDKAKTKYCGQADCGRLFGNYPKHKPTPLLLAITGGRDVDDLQWANDDEMQDFWDEFQYEHLWSPDDEYVQGEPTLYAGVKLARTASHRGSSATLKAISFDDVQEAFLVAETMRDTYAKISPKFETPEGNVAMYVALDVSC